MIDPVDHKAATVGPDFPARALARRRARGVFQNRLPASSLGDQTGWIRSSTILFFFFILLDSLDPTIARGGNPEATARTYKYLTFSDTFYQ
jgi:hypothetical protein